jgi:hypothetical protein
MPRKILSKPEPQGQDAQRANQPFSISASSSREPDIGLYKQGSQPNAVDMNTLDPEERERRWRLDAGAASARRRQADLKQKAENGDPTAEAKLKRRLAQKVIAERDRRSRLKEKAKTDDNVLQRAERERRSTLKQKAEIGDTALQWAEVENQSSMFMKEQNLSGAQAVPDVLPSISDNPQQPRYGRDQDEFKSADLQWFDPECMDGLTDEQLADLQRYVADIVE